MTDQYTTEAAVDFPEPPQPERVQRCSHCGLVLNTFTSDPDQHLILGPCCEGIGSQPRRAPIPIPMPLAIVEDEDEEYAPGPGPGQCQSCGSEAFDVNYTEEVTNYCSTRAYTNGDEVYVSYDSTQTDDSESHEVTIQEVRCRGCGAAFNGDYSWE